jgi:hypothetical protein
VLPVTQCCTVVRQLQCLLMTVQPWSVALHHEVMQTGLLCNTLGLLLYDRGWA